MAKAASSEAPAQRKRLLTIGGCNTLEIGKKLAWLYEHTHIWHGTWPSLGSAPFKHAMPLEDEPALIGVSRFAERDADKSDRERILHGGYDIVLSTAQFTHMDFVVRDGLCIADFTGPAFLSEDMLKGRPRPNIMDYAGEGARLVTWREPEYADLVVEGFLKTYDAVFAPLAKAGCVIAVYDHVLSDTELTPDGEIPFGDPDVAERIAVNRRIVSRVGERPGIHWLRSIRDVTATAADAPWGLSETHPVEEQYVELAGRVARLAGDKIQGTLFKRHARSMHQQILGQARSLTDINARLADAERRLAAATEALDALRGTLSWRITRPLRAIRRLTRPAAKAP